MVPRAAFHEGGLYVVNADRRLEIRPVTIGLVQGDLAAVDEGIEPGERIVVSDLTPAVAGMLLAPQPDERLQTRLKAEAAGGTPRP